MGVVPVGKFTMGSPEKKRERSSDEEPQHQVTISQPFAVGKYEVTVGQFTEFVLKQIILLVIVVINLKMALGIIRRLLSKVTIIQ